MSWSRRGTDTQLKFGSCWKACDLWTLSADMTGDTAWFPGCTLSQLALFWLPIFWQLAMPVLMMCKFSVGMTLRDGAKSTRRERRIVTAMECRWVHLHSAVVAAGQPSLSSVPACFSRQDISFDYEPSLRLRHMLIRMHQANCCTFKSDKTVEIAKVLQVPTQSRSMYTDGCSIVQVQSAASMK